VSGADEGISLVGKRLGDADGALDGALVIIHVPDVAPGNEKNPTILENCLHSLLKKAYAIQSSFCKHITSHKNASLCTLAKSKSPEIIWFSRLSHSKEQVDSNQAHPFWRQSSKDVRSRQF